MKHRLRTVFRKIRAGRAEITESAFGDAGVRRPVGDGSCAGFPTFGASVVIALDFLSVVAKGGTPVSLVLPRAIPGRKVQKFHIGDSGGGDEVIGRGEPRGHKSPRGCNRRIFIKRKRLDVLSRLYRFVLRINHNGVAAILTLKGSGAGFVLKFRPAAAALNFHNRSVFFLVNRPTDNEVAAGNQFFNIV